LSGVRSVLSVSRLEIPGVRKTNSSGVKEQKRLIENEIQELRTTINTHLDKLQENLMMELTEAETFIYPFYCLFYLDKLGITVDSEKSQEVQYQSVSDHLSCDKQNNSSPRCRLPLDEVPATEFWSGFSLSVLSLLDSDWL
jgi:hypothetical protein